MGQTWLNYHHLLYFHTVAQLGTVREASERLRLAPSTVSAQITSLEEALGAALFVREGRRLVLSDAGRYVKTYADAIFALGGELVDGLQRGRMTAPAALRIGVADVVPKLVSQRLIAPALRGASPSRLICTEGSVDALAAALEHGELDVALTDRPVRETRGVRVELLLRSAVTVFGTAALVRRYLDGFPGSLSEAPLLMPGHDAALRRTLEPWLDAHGVRPRVVAEIEDSALMKAFGQAGVGLFAAPTVIEAEVQRRYEVGVVGRCEGVAVSFYAVTRKRHVAHPGVEALLETARESSLCGLA